MNKEPETYEELVRYKKCVDLVSYYELSQKELDKIYNYLATHSKAIILGNESSLTLKDDSNSELPPEIINAKCKSFNIDGVKLTNDSFTIIPHRV